MTETRDPDVAGRRKADAIGVDSVLPGEAATLRAAQASLSGESRGMRGLWPFLGPAFIAAVAVYRPGQLRHEHRGRREVRLPALLGGRLRELDGDAGADALREAGDRDRPQPAGDLPRQLSPTGVVRALAPGGGDRDGDRPGRGPRRRARPQPSVRHAALPRRAAGRRGSPSGSWPFSATGFAGSKR